MTATTMTLGGPLSIACPFCLNPRGERCWVHDLAGGRPRTCRTHAARVKAAPPAEEVGAGDLVLVQLTPGRGAKHLLALLVEPGDTPLVRLWRGGPSAFATPRRVVRSALLRRAPDDDPRVAPARVFLHELTPKRGRVFDTERHGRIWIVDANELAVQWRATMGENNGLIALDEWKRAAIAGEITAGKVETPREEAQQHCIAAPLDAPWAAPKGW